MFLALAAEYSDSLEDALLRIINMDRHDVDFTDRVWTVLKSKELEVFLAKEHLLLILIFAAIANWDELIEVFHIMLKYVEGKMYRPYVSKQKVRMARN